ncbi:TonB-dependent siderophore receptor [Ectopseudomonas mendocina]|uniref:TonB-dependent receptor n=1 Tax=Ectopseudomonas mendocina TaxID=300 RepID=UPI001AE03130|nr:TonB-dependent siderophore receptor [Pseudomonas mendocina]QTN46604.1 TonB-dependent siderophore receptor [Pseudomonas mendocina]
MSQVFPAAPSNLSKGLAPAFGLMLGACTLPVLANDAAVQLPATQVTGQNVPYKADRASSAKIAVPLLDAPQSVNVVPREVLEEQNAQTLQEVLRNVPGITFMSGEGNLGWGDLFSIRGFSSEQSLTVDGVRDSGMSSRTDTFNLEQAEVYKGTGSVESGVSAIGGSVNLVSKRAHLGDDGKLSAGIGSDNYKRLTADINREINDTSALRINLMKHGNAVAERDEVDYDRWGLATSFGFGLGTDTRFWLDAFYQKDENTPDGGVPIQRGTDGKRMPGVSRDAWYGDSSLYTQQTETRSLTGLVEHDFDDSTTLRNQLRWQQTDNWAVLSPARFVAANADGSRNCTGTRCASLGYVGVGPVSSVNGVNAYTDYANSGDTRYGYLRGSDFGLSKRYSIIDNQTDLSFAFASGGIGQQAVTGIELYKETYAGLHKSMKVPDGAMFFDMTDPAHHFASTYERKGYGDAATEVKDAGLYVSDTLTFSPQWQLLLSLRYDRWKVSTENGGNETSRRDDTFGGRAGLVFKPAHNGSIYLSYSQSSQPSAIGATTNNQVYGAASTANYEPAKASTYELGTKWELLDERLGLTAAIFRTELENSWEYSEGEASPVRALPAKRVDGIELGLQGQLTSKWSAYAGFAAMKSRQTKGVNKGEEAKNVPDLTANLWTTYDLSDDLSVSYGANYVGRRRYSDNKYVGGLNNNSSYADGPGGVAAIYTRDHEKAPGYWLHSVAARYQVDASTTLNLNVDNLFNKFYYSRIGASLDGFQLYGVPGAGRTVTASVDYSF